jgi:hypothetical protein
MVIAACRLVVPVDLCRRRPDASVKQAIQFLESGSRRREATAYNSPYNVIRVKYVIIVKFAARITENEILQNGTFETGVRIPPIRSLYLRAVCLRMCPKSSTADNGTLKILLRRIPSPPKSTATTRDLASGKVRSIPHSLSPTAACGKKPGRYELFRDKEDGCIKVIFGSVTLYLLQSITMQCSAW